jgi:poly(A) polymerase Pap1
MNNLGDFEKSVELVLAAKFNNKGFTLNTLTSGLTPPKSMANAIEQRNNAVQLANQVKNELETSKMYLNKIDAETRMKSSGLTKCLQQQYIEAIRNTKNKVIITDGKTPIMISQ